MNTNRKLAGAVAGTALIALSAVAVQAGTESAGAARVASKELVDPTPQPRPARASGGSSLSGAWIATVDPLPNPAGDQPPFESTLAYSRSHVVNEITSRATSTSAGLGAWEKVGDSTYRTRWQKYRFDGTGAYLGRTVVTEEITVVGKNRYEGRARTQVVDSSGAVVAQFESEVAAARLTP